MKSKRCFSIVELLVVLVIVGVLATLGATQFNAAKEKALDKEVEANLRLILSAERVYRMETAEYFDLATTQLINAGLRLSLPVSSPNWAYTVTRSTVDDFCAQSTRTVGTSAGRQWHIHDPVTAAALPEPLEPVAGACH